MHLFGDNGIISNAQNATIKQSEAELTEFLQEEYINDQVEVLTADESEDVTPLARMLKINSEYFYNPKKDSTVSTGYDYIYYYDSDTDAYYDLYFVKVSGLPENIRKSVKGGLAIDSTGKQETYAGYNSLTDCYLVSKDLTVTYLSGILDTSKIERDTDGGLKTAFNKTDSWTKLLTGGNEEEVSIQDAMGITDLTISDDSGIKELTNIYALSNLKKLTLTNYTGSLKGIGNASSLTWLYINNKNGTTNINYSGIEGAVNLSELYFYMPSDTEVEKMFTAMHNVDYTRLATIGFWGYQDSRLSASELSRTIWESVSLAPHSSLTTTKSFDLLSTNTKSAVKVLAIQNNSINDLTGLEDFINVNCLRLRYNYLTAIDKLNTLTKISSIDVGYNDISDISVFNNMEQLSFCIIENNSKIETLSTFIREKTNASSQKYNPIGSLYAYNLPNLDFSTNISVWNDANKEKFGRINNLYIDSKYSLSFTNNPRLTLDPAVTNDEFKQLQNNKSIRYLYMQNCKSLDNATINLILGSMTNLIFVNATGVTGMEDLNWINTNLQGIYLRGTKVTNIEPLFNCSLKIISLDNTQQLYIEDNSVHNSNAGNFISSICARQGRIDNLGGFEAGDSGILKQVEKLNNLTAFGGYVNNNVGYTIDLRNTALVRVTNNRSLCTGMILPYTVEHVNTESANITILPKSDTDKTCNLKSFYSNWVFRSLNVKGICTDVNLTFSGPQGFSSSLLNLEEGSTIKTLLIGCSETARASLDFSNLSKFTRIKGLILTHVTVTNFDFVHLNNNIENIYLDDIWVNGYKLKTLPNLKLLTNLRRLIITNNNFSTLADLTVLNDLGHDFYLDLRNNCLDKTFTTEELGTVNTFDYLLSMKNIKGIYVGGNANLIEYIKTTNYNNYSYNGWNQWYDYIKKINGTSYWWRAIGESMTSPSYNYEKGTTSRYVDSFGCDITPT